MEKLRAKRAPLRTSFTKTLNAIKTHLDEAQPNKGNLIDQLTKLENTFSEIKCLDSDIFDCLIETGSNEKVLNNAVEDAEKYSDELITVKRLVNERVYESFPISARVQESLHVAADTASPFLATSSVNKRQYKLPKLNIPVYDGTLLNYLSFWSQFNKIHEDKDLACCDKFSYLLQSVKPGTRARELLESYPLTSENYPLALKAFQERFGKKELLVEVYVRELLKLIITNVRANGKDKLPLPDLYIKIDAYLRSLETMGLDSKANSAWLFPMVESSLPTEVLKAWQRSPLLSSSTTVESSDSDAAEKNESHTDSALSRLMEFLKLEVEGEERIKLAREGFNTLNEKEDSKEKFRKRDGKIPTATGLFAAKEMSCLFCSKSHESKDCIQARSLSLEEKTSKVREKNCCLKCLRFGHRAKVCKVFVRCHVCSKPHTELFCPVIAQRKDSDSKNSSPEVIQSTVVNKQCSKEVALMTLEVIVNGTKPKKVRALLDSGSQKSYILKRTAKEIGLNPLSTETIAHTLFGGTQTEAKPHDKFRVELSTPRSHPETVATFEFLDQERICGNLPRIPKGPLLKELKKNRLWISDIGPGCPEIEILIGSDIYGKIVTGQIKQLQNGLTAIQTKLGWTICGQLETPSQSSVSSGVAMWTANLSLSEMKIPELWRLETIGITDPSETLSKAEEEELAHDHFVKELSRNEEGRYCVGLPWVNCKQEIPSNRQVAEKRLISATRKLKATKQFENYDRVFQEWEAEKVISKVSEDALKIPGHYLPHHAVIKPGSQTTAIRPVFDASCKTGRAPSLNDCLFKGPNLIEQIPAILLRFREDAIAVVADIRRAFLQIEVKETDRNFLRFLWWNGKDEIQTYQHNRVVFGATCSPFLLGAVIKYHLSNTPEEAKLVAEKLGKSFYIDNCVTSVKNIPELEEFVLRSREIMAEAKMDLRMWQFGPVKEIDRESFKNKELLEEDLESSVPVLGLQWERQDDTLKFCNKFDLKLENLSKRHILAITQGVYDPIGFLSPALLPAKVIIQEAWSTRAEWDTPLPEDLQKRFRKWFEELKYLSEVKIARRIGYGDKENWSIHVFCDSSQKAYATVIFLRCTDEDRVYVQFLGAKSRLAPKKRTTIPRLELLACVLGSRLANFILKALDIFEVPIRYWSDSSTALAWIRRNDQWGTFVGNRTKEIGKLTDPQRWSFVPGHHNPADLPSRGCNPQAFLKTRWWEGPEWLRLEEEEWPTSEIAADEDVVKSEIRKTATVSSLICQEADRLMEYERISKFTRCIRILCWVKRFIVKCRNRNQTFPLEISAEEKNEAEKLLWTSIQRENFGNVTDSWKGLVVMKDQDGIIRVKTKLLDRDDEYSFKYPILLPQKHHVVNSLIQDCHLKHCHAGSQTVGSILREKYWIISAKRNIRGQLSKCVKCKRFTAKPCVSPPIHLPSDRVRDCKVFEVVGVDLCGPLFLKRKSKVWILIYTCAVYRAVHLELVTNLSTEGFIQALRRAIARRGRPSTVYSDNGTNFTGTNNLLKTLDWNRIISSEDISPIKWKFIPPTAAWWGGWWERLIRSVKNLLLRTLGNSCLNFEELMTLLCDVEATINSRPLTYLAEETDKFVPLTPAAFIQDITEIGVPDLDVIDSKKLQQRYKHCQDIRVQLRNKFRKEYLAELVQKSKDKGQTVRKGDIVLIELSNQKRHKWPIGKIVKILPSRDGCARVAEVKTPSGTLIRPLRRIYPLEVSSPEDPVIQNQNFKLTKTRSGRIVKPPTL